MEYENNYTGYEDLRLYPDESPVITALKGLIGAAAGAVPGMAIWILLGKLGVISSLVAFLIAAGVIFGFHFMTKKGKLPFWLSAVICIGIMAISVYISQRVIWSWELMDVFKKELPGLKERIYAYMLEELPDYTRADIDKSLGPNWFNDYVKEEYGITEATFSECFSNFGQLLDALELKGKYLASLGKSYLFSFIGMGGIFARFIAANG